MRIAMVLACLMLSGVWATITATAADSSFSELRLKVIDGSGSPVVGAKADITVMTLSNGIAITAELDPATSDKLGIATLRFPAAMQVDGETASPIRIVGTVKRIGYTMNIFREELGNPDATVVLKKETSLQVTAVDANGLPLGDFGVLVTGRDDDFGRSTLAGELDPNGKAVFVGMGTGTQQALVVRPMKDKRHLFSSVQSLSFSAGQDIRLRNVPLKLGKSLGGQVLGDIPRPIQGGFVVVCCRLRSRRQVPTQQRLHWFDSTAIQADGTYRFASLPDCEVIQMIATCKGASMQVRQRDAFAKSGIEIVPKWNANQGVGLATQDISMQATCSATVRVVDRNGDPVPIAGVSVRPQVTWTNDVSLMGIMPLRSVASLAMMPGAGNPVSRKFEWDHQWGRGTTDKEGRFRLTGLALDQEVRIFVQLPGDQRGTTQSVTIEKDNQEIKIQAAP